MCSMTPSRDFIQISKSTFCIFVGLLISCQMDPETGQVSPFVQLTNVDTCDRSGPEVPIKLTTSANTSITFHPDGYMSVDGDISVQSLPCSDNHTQEYKVTVNSTENYNFTGEIISALLPKCCVLVTNSSNCSCKCSFTIIVVVSHKGG